MKNGTNFPSTQRRVYLLALFLLLGLSALQGQVGTQASTARTPGYWTLGLNAGWSYQTSDVQAQWKGYGWGLTLAKNVYYRPGSAIAFDWRGRFLFAKQYGLDGEQLFAIEQDEALNGQRGLNYTDFPPEFAIVPGFVFANHETLVGELALEGVLSFNRLREQTNIHLALYGGLGIDWYRTKINQTDVNGQPYYEDYVDLRGQEVRDVRRELRNAILDDSYETLAHDFSNSGKLGIMPSVGIELGYQLTPRFSIIGGHRVTFSGTDQLDGQPWTDSNNDLYHYTHLGLRWILEPGRSGGRAPEIVFDQPSYTPYVVDRLPMAVRARISNMSDRTGIEAYLNGQRTDFDFSNGSFRRVLNQLSPGENEFTIQARNRYGSDRESIILVFGDIDIPPPPPTGSAPRITITQPRSNPFTSNSATTNILATTSHLDRREQIRMTVNGQNQGFNFDTRRQQISAQVPLRTGRNEVIISGQNSVGQDEARTIIYYEQAIDNSGYLSVRITEPSDGYRTNSSRTFLRASVQGVDRKSDITLSIRGRQTSDFSYDASREEITADISLANGSNTVEVRARNQGGSDTDQVTVYRGNVSPPPPPPPPNQPRPSIQITRPADNSVSNSTRTNVEAQTSNVQRRNDIQFTVNGRAFNDFTFDAYRQRITANVPLNSGNNTVRIVVRSPNGEAQDGVNIRYQAAARPQVTISDPRANATVSEAAIQFLARTQNVDRREEITLKVNRRQITNFNFDGRNIRANLSLSSGQNTIEVEVRTDGGTDQDDVRVEYRPIERPSVQIISPSANPYTTDQQTLSVRARTTGITRADQVTVRYNGRIQSDFSFNQQQQEVSLILRLSPGAKTFEIEARNSAGTDRDQATFTYEREAAPSVQFTAPDDGAILTTNRTTVRADIAEVSNKNQLTFTVNGQTRSSFTLNGNQFQATVSLKQGANAFRLQATNSAGTASDELRVQYQAAVAIPKPVITFVRPKTSGTTVNRGRQTIAADIDHISSKRDITVKVNNKSYRDFTYDARSQQLQMMLDLSEGKNSIVITATNKSGATTASTRINYSPPAAGPTVTITSVSRPVQNPLAPGIGVSTVLAELSGVSNQNQITFLVNGTTNADFTYNSSTGEFSSEIQLTRGENVIIVRAATADGSAEDQRTIEF